MANDDLRIPTGSQDDKELLLQWLDYLRGAVLRKVEGLDDARARWTPEGKLIPLLGIIHHGSSGVGSTAGSAEWTSVAPRKSFDRVPI